jgi:hypothetical protein
MRAISTLISIENILELEEGGMRVRAHPETRFLLEYGRKELELGNFAYFTKLRMINNCRRWSEYSS